MLKVHVNTGATLSYDLRDEEQLAEWERASADEAFQDKITGVALLHNKTLHTLPLPKKFRTRRFTADVLYVEGGKGDRRQLGERVTCQADNIRVSITAYYTRTPKMVRYDVTRTGWQRHVATLNQEA